MRSILVAITLALVVAAAFSLGQFDRPVTLSANFSTGIDGKNQTVEIPLRVPIILDPAKAASIELTVQGYGAEHVGLLEIGYADAAIMIVDARNARAGRHTCSGRPGAQTCRIIVRTEDTGRASLQIYADEGKATIRSLSFETVTAKRHASASGFSVVAGFFLLMLLGPMIVQLRKFPGWEHRVLIAGGIAWIGFASLYGLAVTMIFVVAGYAAIRAVMSAPTNRGRLAISLIAGVALLIILFKFSGPVMAAAFANPGGMWLALPLGLSYLAIRLVDLLLAASAQTLRELTLRDYMAFMLSPYTLPAGPIQLYSAFMAGRMSDYSMVEFTAGMARFGIGLGKKLIADSYLLPVTTAQMGIVLTGEGDPYRASVIMLSANLLYVYLDFSAYCDLAIGAARAGGRRIPENFDWPLLRNGVRAYWRHWHMTLSQWVMRRVYFPAHLSSRSATLSLFASMLVIGLWHSPSLPWSLWAAHHSLAMAAEGKIMPNGPENVAVSMPMRTLVGILGPILTFAWVALGHSFTLFASTGRALQVYGYALCSPIHAAKNLLIG